MFPKTSYAPSVLHARLRSYATSRFSCHYLLQSPYIPVPVQALIFSLKVFNFASGMHGHQAIVSFLPLVTTVDHGALPWSTLKNAISEPRACARQGHCPMRSASVLPARVDRPAEELSASCYGSPLEPCALPNRATSHFQIVAIYHFQIVLLPNCITSKLYILLPNCATLHAGFRWRSRAESSGRAGD